MWPDSPSGKNSGEIAYLIIDPDGEARRSFISALDDYGLTTYFEAGDAVVGLHVLLEQNIRFILVCEHMVTVSGLEFVRFVRGGRGHAIDPETPIIVLGEAGEREMPARVRDAGANGFLSKTVAADILYDTIRRVVIEPQPFVRFASYSGPDRRREDLGPPGGVERRRGG